MSFELVPDEHLSLAKGFEAMARVLETMNVKAELLRDLSNGHRFVMTFETESDLDSLTTFLQDDNVAKACFKLIKESESRLVVRAMESFQ